MTARERGAALLLAALLAGRVLDRFDLPFEARPQPEDARPSDTGTAAASAPRADAANVDTVGADPMPDPRRAAAAPVTPIDINRAGARELESLPGIGPVLAARIVAYRDAHGAFTDVAALRKVSGIGPRTLARLSPHLRCD